MALEEEDGRFRVVIRDGAGHAVSERTCGSEEEALAFVSTVRQHIRWLSEAKFREYYGPPVT